MRWARALLPAPARQAPELVLPPDLQPCSNHHLPALPRSAPSPSGTGKVHGDRHPKISDNVLIGASASILGNIRVGKEIDLGHCRLPMPVLDLGAIIALHFNDRQDIY